LFLVRVAVSATALLVAALLVPGIEVAWGQDVQRALFVLLVLGIVFGMVNTLVRPIARLLAIPLGLLTLGTFSFALNAALLLMVAALVDAVGRRLEAAETLLPSEPLLTAEPLLRVGGFPPTLTLEAFAVAAVGSFIISAVGTAMSLLIPDA